MNYVVSKIVVSFFICIACIIQKLMVYGNFTSYAAVRGFTPEMVSMNMQNVFF